MRKEPFTIGNYIHVYNRGNRKEPIIRDARDKWHFLQILYYFNDEYTPPNPFHTLRKLLGSELNNRLIWPEDWPKRDPLVKILVFALMNNHYHLLLKEIKTGGVSRFMKRLSNGMTNYFNTKYQENGHLFQGSYKARLVNEEMYLKDLSVYIQVKNPFELYPGGFKKAVTEFNKAYNFAVRHPYCSLADYAGKRKSPIIDKDILEELFENPKEYKDFASNSILARDLEEKLGDLAIDLD